MDEGPTGARFQFDRVEATSERARYRVTIRWPEGASTVEVAMQPNEATLGDMSALLPWMQEHVAAFARVIAKNYDPEVGWPRLVHRWRAPK